MKNNLGKNYVVPYRRFGRTEINMPILSLGGMRFQQSWSDIPGKDIHKTNQEKLENILKLSMQLGLHHIETARHYGTSEMQLGWAFQSIPDSKRIIQTKVPPMEDPKKFEAELEISFERLKSKKINLLSIHGLNLPEHFEQTIRPNGCLDVLKRWRKKGLIEHIGFSTHGPTDLIIDVINTNQFDYVNLHWYFIYQDNIRAINAANKLDLGVFIISPTDKGGHLHSPSSKLISLCNPIHPIVFNDLFCLNNNMVHTISIGTSNLIDFDFHIQAVKNLHQSKSYIPSITKKLNNEAIKILGKSWMTTWHQGLPAWHNTPGNINIPLLLWLYNLSEAWDMTNYARARYSLLGNGGHWFPGENADCLDLSISEVDLRQCLVNSPWIDSIPGILRKLKERCGGSSAQRLSSK